MRPLDHVVDIILAFLVLFLFPLLYFGLKQDSIIITKTNTDTISLVDDVRSRGYLTKDMYDQYLEQLSDTGLMYDISMEHRQLIYEPEYRFRTAEEIIEAQNTAYAGTNEYHYYAISTEKPAVSDPVNTGNLNTQTNESIMAVAVNSAALGDHVHTSDCYTGHRHSDNGCLPCGDLTKKLTVSCSNNYDHSYYYGTVNLSVDCSTCGENLLRMNLSYRTDAAFSYVIQFQSYISYHRYDTSGKVIDASISDYYQYSGLDVRQWSSKELQFNRSMASYVCSIPNYFYKWEDGSNGYGKNLNWGGLPIYDYIGDYTFKTVPWLGCLYCETYGSNYSCGLTEDTTADCSQVVTSINATHPIQTVAVGDSLITTVIATYLDGSTKTIVSTASGYDSGKLGTQTVTLAYTDLVDTAKISGTKTRTITITVIPRTKTCINGHTYNLNTDGTDSGCPYCKAWLKTLVISVPDTKSLTIYRGTTLKENGVSLFATYLDGSTEYITDAYVDNLDKTYIGRQDVTISYKGLAVSLTVTTKKNIILCLICGRYYELYPDDTDPGCPFCAALTPIFSGNVMKYYDEKYTAEIEKELFEGSGIYYFTKEDYFLISICNNSRSLGGKLTAFIYKFLADGNIQMEYGGYIRENGQ